MKQDMTKMPQLRRKWVRLDDRSQEPVLLEDHSDGTYTEWCPGPFGTFGRTFRLKPGQTPLPLTRKKDRERALDLERAMERSGLSGLVRAAAMSGNPNLWEDAVRARRRYRRRWGVAP
jgi:hypothetical protein